MPYRPDSLCDRQDLATKLLAKLDVAGFTKLPSRDAREELVYARPHAKIPNFQIRLYTSVTESPYGGKPVARPSGADAIRACLVYIKPDGSTRGIGSETRVNRTGDIDGICDRTIERLRAVYAKAPSVQRCKCGAPLFMSRNNNLVCADLCWKRGR